jgi:hypothetical protein
MIDNATQSINKRPPVYLGDVKDQAEKTPHEEEKEKPESNCNGHNPLEVEDQALPTKVPKPRRQNATAA